MRFSARGAVRSLPWLSVLLLLVLDLSLRQATLFSDQSLA